MSIPELLGSDAAHDLLNGDISPVTHDILDQLEKLGKESMADIKEFNKVETARLRVMELRAAVAAERQERPQLPYHQDLLTMDMNDYTIKNFVTPFLHSLGLGPATFGHKTSAEPTFPMKGALWGYNQRPFFTFIVEKDDTCVEVPIFVDTGAQETYLNETTMRLLLPPGIDYSVWSPNTTALMKVHGIELPVKLGIGQSLGCNIVGREWLSRAGAVLVADYKRNGCVVLKADVVVELLEQKLSLPKVSL